MNPPQIISPIFRITDLARHRVSGFAAGIHIFEMRNARAVPLYTKALVLSIKVAEIRALCWYDREHIHAKLSLEVKEMYLLVGKYCLTPKDSFTLLGRI
ncbi:hypothetical protein [Roseibium aggregatum]|uniref:hypothetical protein n=1 Tax=Roseibium aggregatum TaxID=187304 RepID=UPI001E4DE470|nr:hypothetical protein [Roseibium aggregatum]